jgi:hypothetical protein
MAFAAKEELYIPRRSPRPIGLGGAVLRALAVMAVLDVAFMLVIRDEEPQPPAAAAAAEEMPEAAPARQVASTKPVVRPAGEAGAGDATAATPEAATERPPLAAAPLPQPIPAAVALPSPPAADPPARRDPAIVLPASKPRPPAAIPHAKPARRAAPHARHVPEPPLQRTSLVEAAAPQTIRPPPCKPYTAETTLAGETRPVRGIACPEPDGTWRIVTERASLD